MSAGRRDSYKKSANLLEAVHQLMEYFQQYEDIPKVRCQRTFALATRAQVACCVQEGAPGERRGRLSLSCQLTAGEHDSRAPEPPPSLARARREGRPTNPPGSIEPQASTGRARRNAQPAAHVPARARDPPQVKSLAKRLALLEQQLTASVLDDFKTLMGTVDIKVC